MASRRGITPRDTREVYGTTRYALMFTDGYEQQRAWKAERAIKKAVDNFTKTVNKYKKYRFLGITDSTSRDLILDDVSKPF